MFDFVRQNQNTLIVGAIFLLVLDFYLIDKPSNNQIEGLRASRGSSRRRRRRKAKADLETKCTTDRSKREQQQLTCDTSENKDSCVVDQVLSECKEIEKVLVEKEKTAALRTKCTEQKNNILEQTTKCDSEDADSEDADYNDLCVVDKLDKECIELEQKNKKDKQDKEKKKRTVTIVLIVVGVVVFLMLLGVGYLLSVDTL
jgi:hypothetical protein